MDDSMNSESGIKTSSRHLRNKLSQEFTPRDVREATEGSYYGDREDTQKCPIPGAASELDAASTISSDDSETTFPVGYTDQLLTAPVNTQHGWTAVYSRLKDQDKTMIEGYSADMDTLLLFAGLFSAVLTALLGNVYNQLQPDNAQKSVQILSEIYRQVHNISTGAVASNDTLAPSSQFSASTATVAVNLFWFLSLIFSLAAALLAIFVKQWLREYMLWTSISPVRDAVHVRQYRHRAFKKWRVLSIVTALPTLLQIALGLFYAGLLVLLWSINLVIAIAATVATGLGLLCTVTFTVLPVIFSSCPYKTPLAWALLHIPDASIHSWRATKRGVNAVKIRLGTSILWGAHLVRARTVSSIKSLSTSLCRLVADFGHHRNELPFTTRASVSHVLPNPVQGEDSAEPSGDVEGTLNPTLTGIHSYVASRPRDIYKDNWARRDLHLSFVSLGDSFRIGAWNCMPLLQLGEHQNLDIPEALACSSDIFGDVEEVSVVSALRDATYISRVNPHMRMCSYWVAISEYLGYPTRDALPLYKDVFKLGEQAMAVIGDPTLPANATFGTLRSKLVNLSPHCREMLFHLLCNGIQYALDCGEVDLPSNFPLLEDGYLQCIYLTSLYMMRLLCHRWSNLHPVYFRLLYRILADGQSLHCPGGSDALRLYCWRILDMVAENLECVDYDAKALIAVNRAASQLQRSLKTRTDKFALMAATNSALALRLRPTDRSNSGISHRYQLSVDRLLRTVEAALPALTEVPADAILIHKHQLWARLAVFRFERPELASSAFTSLASSAMRRELFSSINYKDMLFSALLRDRNRKGPVPADSLQVICGLREPSLPIDTSHQEPVLDDETWQAVVAEYRAEEARREQEQREQSSQDAATHIAVPLGSNDASGSTYDRASPTS